MTIIISKVTTKQGDNGLTLGPEMKKIEKNSIEINFIGKLDELNCFIGQAMLDSDEEEKNSLNKIQNQIFNLGAIYYNQKDKNTDEMIDFLENKIEQNNKNLPELTSFLLPQGDKHSVNLHLARTKARSAERTFWELKNNKISKIGVYLNRLSDLLFVLIRKKSSSKLWDPKDI